VLVPSLPKVDATRSFGRQWLSGRVSTSQLVGCAIHGHRVNCCSTLWARTFHSTVPIRSKFQVSACHQSNAPVLEGTFVFNHLKRGSSFEQYLTCTDSCCTCVGQHSWNHDCLLFWNRDCLRFIMYRCVMEYSYCQLLRAGMIQDFWASTGQCPQDPTY